MRIKVLVFSSQDFTQKRAIRWLRAAETLTALTIAHRALRDVWPDQVNLVNVERDKEVRSALFAEGSEGITISLE